jgi:hypothetical protein
MRNVILCVIGDQLLRKTLHNKSIQHRYVERKQTQKRGKNCAKAFGSKTKHILKRRMGKFFSGPLLQNNFRSS